MGTSGPGIFQDDFACEVRDELLERLYAGASAEEAANKLIKSYGELDVDEEPVFWLALAAAQLDVGRLTKKAKVEALKLIQSGKELKRWKYDKGRDRALTTLEKRLLAPPPEPKRLTQRVPKLTPGDVFRLPLPVGGFGYGRVIHGTMRALYLFESKTPDVPIADVVKNDIAFLVGSTDDGLAKRRWRVIGNLPLAPPLTGPLYQFHQAVGSDTCTVFDACNTEPERVVPERECVGLEQWGSASAHHVEERLRAALQGGLSDWSLVKTRVTGSDDEEHGARPARVALTTTWTGSSGGGSKKKRG